MAVAVLSLTGLTVLPSQANASEQHETSAPESRAQVQAPSVEVGTASVAPSCVYRFFEEHWYAFHVHGKNNCSTRQYVKVIIAWGPDSGCKGLDRYQSFTHSFQIGRFDRLDRC